MTHKRLKDILEGTLLIKAQGHTSHASLAKVVLVFNCSLWHRGEKLCS